MRRWIGLALAAMTMAGCTERRPGTGQPTTTSAPVTTPVTTRPAPPRSEDCIPYDPTALRIVDLGNEGWRLEAGNLSMLTLDNRADAEQALALARQANAQCFIGRDNNRPNRKDYLVQYWKFTNPPLGPLPHAEDCIPYDPAALRIVNLGALGWRVESGMSAMLLLDNQAHAERALEVARQHRWQCFIGRGNNRTNRIDYIVQYWR